MQMKAIFDQILYFLTQAPQPSNIFSHDASPQSPPQVEPEFSEWNLPGFNRR